MFGKTIECKNCLFAKLIFGKQDIPSGYVCCINPFNNVPMGWHGDCHKRDKAVKEKSRVQKKQEVKVKTKQTHQFRLAGVFFS